MPLSRDPKKRAKQLANLRPAPAAPVAHTRSLRHGGRAEVLYRDVEAEVTELMEALDVPVRDPDGSIPGHDLAAVEVAARCLKRYRRLADWLDLHGRIDERSGKVKAAAEYELQAERALTSALDVLGMTPTSRAKLGLDLVRAAGAEAELAEQQAARERLDQRLASIDAAKTKGGDGAEEKAEE